MRIRSQLLSPSYSYAVMWNECPCLDTFAGPEELANLSEELRGIFLAVERIGI